MLVRVMNAERLAHHHYNVFEFHYQCDINTPKIKSLEKKKLLN